jgi:hypothetical protein
VIPDIEWAFCLPYQRKRCERKFGVGTDLEREQAGLREGSELEKRNKIHSISKI